MGNEERGKRKEEREREDWTAAQFISPNPFRLNPPKSSTHQERNVCLLHRPTSPPPESSKMRFRGGQHLLPLYSHCTGPAQPNRPVIAVAKSLSLYRGSIDLSNGSGG